MVSGSRTEGRGAGWDRCEVGVGVHTPAVNRVSKTHGTCDSLTDAKDNNSASPVMHRTQVIQ